MRVAFRCRHPGVAKNLLNDSDVNALRDQQSCRRVPGIVDPSVSDRRLLEDGLPGPPVFRPLDRTAPTGGEYKIVIYPRATSPQALGGLLLAVLSKQLQERRRTL